ncbi:MAG: ABC transporter permease [Sphingobacterium sp.]|nr:ABC transporter permease [Sphingobacterium sp.]
MAGQMIFFSFFTGAYAMMSILQESEEGTLARMFTTPTDRTPILAGKFLAVFVDGHLAGNGDDGGWQYCHSASSGGNPAAAALALTRADVRLAADWRVLLVSFVKTSKQAGPILGGGADRAGDDRRSVHHEHAKCPARGL